jgi:hypothetical protein
MREVIGRELARFAAANAASDLLLEAADLSLALLAIADDAL